MSRLDDKAAALVAAELLEGETVLWHERPPAGRLAAVRAWSTLAGVGGVLIAVLFEAGPAQRADVARWLATLWASPGGAATVVAALLAVASGVYLWSDWLALRTVYAVTDRRVMSIAARAPERVKWIGRGELRRVRIERSGRSGGTIVFERDPTDLELLVDSEPGEFPEEAASPEAMETLTFVGVRDPDAVVALVERAFGLRGGRPIDRG